MIIEKAQIAFLCFLGMLVLFVILKIFSKVASAVITFSLGVIVPIVLWIGLSHCLDLYLSLYISITLYFLIYCVFGVFVNQKLLKHIFAHKDADKQYDYKELRNQINLLYAIIFIGLNIYILFNQDKQPYVDLATTVINGVISGVCIATVDWNALLWNKKAE